MKDVTVARRCLPSLVSSRICHDLVNPLGAIGNGLELIQLSGQPSGPEYQLMSDSIESAAARLNFFRIAFGLSGAEQMLASAEARNVLSNYYAQGRLRIAWHPQGDVSRAEARLAMLLVLCAESALPLGGEVSLRHGGVRWVLAATGPRVVVEPELWDMLTSNGDEAEMTAGQVHFALAADAARTLGRPIVLDAGAEDLEISF